MGISEYYGAFEALTQSTPGFAGGNQTFPQNVLSIIGDLILRPFIQDGMACLFNGEIYNHRQFDHFPSDGECLIPALGRHGKRFINHLDGEFAIVLHDSSQNLMRSYTDVFGATPLHFGIKGRDSAVASYVSAIQSLGFENALKVPANTLVEINIKDGSISVNSELFEFSLDQHKEDFSDWDTAFRESIVTCIHNTRGYVFIGLSSGYDSGGISCELNAQGVDYKSYSLLGIEDKEILEERMCITAEHSQSELIPLLQQDIQKAGAYVRDYIEEPRLYISSDGTGHVETPSLHKDGGAVGLAMVCARAKSEKHKLYLSGQGADEILSDYGFAGNRFYPHSNFGDLFPDDLSEIFPWASFYGVSHESYLRKEEYVAGSFGIETRYPYLDTNIVQEFLNLTPKTKKLLL